MRSLVKFSAGVSVSKVSNAKAICWMKLTHQELATSLANRSHLKDGGGRQEDLDITIIIRATILMMDGMYYDNEDERMSDKEYSLYGLLLILLSIENG